MKEKQYTVYVKGYRYNKFKITARGTLKAKEMAEEQFKAEYGHHWDGIESRATADYIPKKRKV